MNDAIIEYFYKGSYYVGRFIFMRDPLATKSLLSPGLQDTRLA